MTNNWPTSMLEDRTSGTESGALELDALGIASGICVLTALGTGTIG